MRFYNDIAVHDDDVIRRIIIIIKYYYYGFSRLAVYNNIRTDITISHRTTFLGGCRSSAIIFVFGWSSSSSWWSLWSHNNHTDMFLYHMDIIFNHLITVRRVLSFTLCCRRHNRQYMHRTYTRDYNRLYTRNTRAYT